LGHEAFWAALEDNLERCNAECAAVDREMKALLAEGRADTEEGRAAQRKRLAELQTRWVRLFAKCLPRIEQSSTRGGPGDGLTFYSRCNFLASQNGKMHCVYLEYPYREERAWDGIVTRYPLTQR
jgi:hypothetical protein